MTIRPLQIDVTAVNDGVVLSVRDHPTRQPVEVIGLTADQGFALLGDLARALVPGQTAAEILARLP